MDFEDDLEGLDKELLNTEQRIKRSEEHKESVKKELSDSKHDNETIAETLRRLERNLDELHKKRAFLIKEKDSKFSQLTS